MANKLQCPLHVRNFKHDNGYQDQKLLMGEYVPQMSTTIYITQVLKGFFLGT